MLVRRNACNSERKVFVENVGSASLGSGKELCRLDGWLREGGSTTIFTHSWTDMIYVCAVYWSHFSSRKEAIWLLYEYTRNGSCWNCEALVDGPRSGGRPSNHQGSANDDEKIVDQAQLHDYIKFFIRSWISFESGQNERNPFVEA